MPAQLEKMYHYQETQHDKRACSLNHTKSVDKAVAREQVGPQRRAFPLCNVNRIMLPNARQDPAA